MTVRSSTELDRLLQKQVNLYRLQELVDSLVMGAKGSRFFLDEAIIKRLHKTAMQLILATAGEYRSGPVRIENSPHQPPPWLDVPIHMATFVKYVNDNWESKDLIHLSAFALWRLNWIHPFDNGNGRTARACSYLVMCGKFGALLPAKNTVIQQIVAKRSPYYKALRLADDRHDKSGGNVEHCLEPLIEHLTFLLKEQLRTSLS